MISVARWAAMPPTFERRTAKHGRYIRARIRAFSCVCVREVVGLVSLRRAVNADFFFVFSKASA